jgi:hypothetical protein
MPVGVGLPAQRNVFSFLFHRGGHLFDLMVQDRYDRFGPFL